MVSKGQKWVCCASLDQTGGSSKFVLSATTVAVEHVFGTVWPLGVARSSLYWSALHDEMTRVPVSELLGVIYIWKVCQPTWNLSLFRNDGESLFLSMLKVLHAPLKCSVGPFHARQGINPAAHAGKSISELLEKPCFLQELLYQEGVQ